VGAETAAQNNFFHLCIFDRADFSTTTFSVAPINHPGLSHLLRVGPIPQSKHLEVIGASENTVILLTQKMSTCIVSKVFVLDDELFRVTVEEDTNAGEWSVSLRAEVRIAVSDVTSHKSTFHRLLLPLDHLTNCCTAGSSKIINLLLIKAGSTTELRLR